MKKSNSRTARVGSRAPSFELPIVAGDGIDRDEVELDDYLDQWLMLLFYPRDFSLI